MALLKLQNPLPAAPKPYPDLSFSKALAPLSLSLPCQPPNRATPAVSLTILMGGGPRTYPGGVSKWQWKRMQAKKAKQLLKARLARERHIYEMRKRAELRAAVSELERPWEPVKAVERAPKLFSVSADEQLKVLADRFQKPGGFDMWTERDGPQLFGREDDAGLSGSARFFPKGVVHSVKPYGRVIGDGNAKDDYEDGGLTSTGFRNVSAETGEDDDDYGDGNSLRQRPRKGVGEVGFDRKQRRGRYSRRGGYSKDGKMSNSPEPEDKVYYDMNLRQDGRYE